MKRILPIVAMLSATYIANGQRLLTEDFNYVPGTLTSANSGSNVSGGNWVGYSGTANNLTVTAGSLSYPGYGTGASATNNNKVAMIATSASAEDAYRSFAPQTGTTVYLSFLANVIDQTRLLENTSTTGDFFVTFLPTGSTTLFNAGRVYIRKGLTANTVNFGVAVSTTANSPIVYAPMDYAVGTPHLITLAFSPGPATGDDTAKLFVDRPVSFTEPLVPDAISILLPTSTADMADVASVVLRQGSATPNVEIDAIKVSTNYYDATLPLDLTSFSAALAGKVVQVKWTTAHENQVKHYSIERSRNGREFQSIGKVEAKNLNNASYQYTDESPLNGSSFYRLLMQDKDGSRTYSAIVNVNSKHGLISDVWPNPVMSNLNVSHGKAAKGAVIIVLDAHGRQLKSIAVAKDAVQTAFPVSEFATGNYILLFDNGGERSTTSFIKR